ncbi:MAG: acyltransferase [Acidobacteria bacterium]|nr:acyltransferase [Acidobacteriota bacterium]
MKRLLRRFVRDQAFRRGRFVGWYRRLCDPDGLEWAAFLKARGVFYAMGEHCSIQRGANITDPKLVRLGNNVRLSNCTLFGHDGSINMINRAFGLKLDRVGAIDIKDNVYIGHGAIVLPGVTIGPDAIVGAGAVVAKDVPPDSVAVGVPAKRLGSLSETVERLKESTARLPWADLIERRRGDFDPVLEEELTRMRVAWFFGEGTRQRERELVRPS